MTAPDKKELLFIPLGGAGEIGMNLNLYGFGNQWVIVDLGVTFADDRLPGIELVMPDPAFIAERREALLGIVLTHAHEDHIGAVPYLWPFLRCPIYATPFTASILRRKLEEVGLTQEAPITIVPLSGRFTLGPFDFELITLTHSIPEPNAVAIRTPLGTILHTGDWKIDPDPLVGPVTDTSALRRIGEEGVLAMICDSTNVLRSGVSGSEAELRSSLAQLVARCRQRVAIACFASNIARLETIAAVAEANGRHAALIGRSLWRFYEAALENGYLRNIPPFLSDSQAANLPRDKVVLAMTGSQGEPRSALARVVAGEHALIVLEEGDTAIFSSRIIPGNERAIFRLQSALAHIGVEVVTEHDEFVHVSGHPARDELAEMYAWVRPQIAVPVHGEMRHLIEHARFARTCQVRQAVVVANGDVLRLAPGSAEIVDHVHAGRLALDGTELVPTEGEVVKSRTRMLWHGVAVATVVLDKRGRLIGAPQLALPGLVGDEGTADLTTLASAAISDELNGLPDNRRSDDETVREAIRLAIRRSIRSARGKKPAIEIHLVRV
ncbi:MAG TPA: ribonuclease J [Alphaproteobacteria bacterium]|nr:ribonuclease J [Alphaproteobacteria bacterium]